MKAQHEGAPKWALLLFRLYTVVLLLLGVALVILGLQLIFVGGSWYYALMGIALAVSAVYLWRLKSAGLFIFAAASLVTWVWALWEVGLDGWPLIPRLAWITVLGLILLAFWKVISSAFDQVNKKVYLAAGTVIPGLMAITIVYPLFVNPHVNVASASLAQSRPTEAFSRAQVASPDGNVAGSHDASNWTSYGGSNLSNKFTPSAQITPDNAKQLVEAWHFHTGDVKPDKAAYAYAFQNTPLMVNNTLYVCTPSQIVIAVDPEKGTEKWRFDPEADRVAMARSAASTCRGVAYHASKEPLAECTKRIVWPAADGRIGAIDADTGKLCTSFANKGYFNLNEGTGNTLMGFVSPTSPPLIMRDTIIIGTGQVRDGTERDAPSGVVRGYDAVTGQLRWAWDLGNKNITAEPPEGQTYTRSTPNVWSLLAGDDELGLVYIPTGNPASDFYGEDRTPEEDEYTATLVAVDAKTGKERWHFRTVNHDLWDFDLSPQPNLVDFPTPNGPRPAVVQATKNGQIYVLDRATGEPIMPVVETPVPQGTDTEDWTAKTQPLSPGMPNTVGAPNKTMEVLTESDAWGMTPFDQLACRIQFKKLRYEGAYTPPTLTGSLAYAGNHGGVNWGGVSIDIQRGIMIVNNNRLPYTEQLFTREKIDELGVQSIYRGKSKVSGYMPQVGSKYGARKEPWMSPLKTPCIAPPWGYISGTDLRTQEVIWSRPLGTGYDAGPMGIHSKVKLEMGTPNNSGSLTTAGGMTFIGAALDLFMRGYNTETGDLVWEVRLPAGAQANPMSYEINGRQYIVAAVGGHQRMDTKLGDSVIAWALPQK